MINCRTCLNVETQHIISTVQIVSWIKGGVYCCRVSSLGYARLDTLDLTHAATEDSRFSVIKERFSTALDLTNAVTKWNNFQIEDSQIFSDVKERVSTAVDLTHAVTKWNDFQIEDSRIFSDNGKSLDCARLDN